MASKLLCPTESKMLLTSIQLALEFVDSKQKKNHNIWIITFLFRACKLVFSVLLPYVVKCKLASFHFWKIQKLKIFILLLTGAKCPACLFYSLQLILNGEKFKLNIHLLSSTLYFFQKSYFLNCYIVLEFLFTIFHLIFFSQEYYKLLGGQIPRNK